MKRVILKLSGEALAGEQKSGYDDALIADIARQVKAIIDKGIDVGVVIGEDVPMIILIEQRQTRLVCLQPL